jgi:hypothetical protein
VKPEEFARRLPTLISRYEEVAALMDKPRTSRPRKVSHKEVLDDWMLGRNMSQTARGFGISNNMVWLIVYRALRMAEDLARIESVPGRRGKQLRQMLGKD